MGIWWNQPPWLVTGSDRFVTSRSVTNERPQIFFRWFRLLCVGFFFLFCCLLAISLNFEGTVSIDGAWSIPKNPPPPKNPQSISNDVRYSQMFGKNHKEFSDISKNLTNPKESSKNPKESLRNPNNLERILNNPQESPKNFQISQRILKESQRIPKNP